MASRTLATGIRVIVAFLVPLTIAGCTKFGAHKDWAREGVVLGIEDRPRSNQLSRETQEILFRENLQEVYSRNQRAAFEQLVASILKDPERQEDPALLFAAAEFANVLAERDAPPWNRRPFIRPLGRAPDGRTDLATKVDSKVDSMIGGEKEYLTYYRMASYFSYLYLARASKELKREAFNPHFRQACEIHNYSLEQTLRFALNSFRFDPKSFYTLGAPDGPQKVRFEYVGFDWKQEDVHELLPAEDYRPEEIELTSRRKGMGVPLIGVRYSGEEEELYPPVCAFPVTAMDVLTHGTDLETTENSDVIHLINPWSEESIRIGEADVPVEADLTTPIHFMLETTGFNSGGVRNFFDRDAAATGSVFLIQPHRRGRIPVIFCHGLLSSPGPWGGLINALLDDPRIRENYEFWLMHYPTGRGMMANAAQLRESLARVRNILDPDGDDPALDRMVLVGHSMGGLISTLLSHDSGNVFWDAAWSAPIDRLDLTVPEREALERAFFFERVPGITRVVYLASPFGGAPLASRPLAKLGNRLVDLPKDVIEHVGNAQDRNGQFSRLSGKGNMMKSVGQLRQDSPLLEALARLDHPKEVAFHNIVGNISDPGEKGTDGVVPLVNAEADWVGSRVEVPARHRGIQRHPLTVREIERILHEHLVGATPPPSSLPPSPTETPGPSTRRAMPEIGIEGSLE